MRYEDSTTEVLEFRLQEEDVGNYEMPRSRPQRSGRYANDGENDEGEYSERSVKQKRSSVKKRAYSYNTLDEMKINFGQSDIASKQSVSRHESERPII